MAGPFEPSPLGVGIVWWSPLDPLCQPTEGLLDVIEIEPEAFWIPAPEGSGFCSFAGRAVQHLPQPKLLHSVGAPVGGTCPAPAGHSQALARDMDQLCPGYWSEHLNLTRFRPQPEALPVSAGFMLPSLQSQRMVEIAAENIRRHRAQLREHRAAFPELPLAIETAVNYLPPMPGEWPDGVFVAAVAEAADCGILLDLHNLLCNQRNGRQSIEGFCRALPLDRVWEIHLAGGESEAGLYLDAHSGLICPELMETAAELVPKLPNLAAITFEIMPERVASTGLSAIAAQLKRLRDLWNTRSSAHPPWEASLRARPDSEPCVDDPEIWERLLGCAITRLPPPSITREIEIWWQSADHALRLYRSLAEEARAGSILSAAPHTIKLLLKQRGPRETRLVLSAYWQSSPPQYTAIEEARAFFRFLAGSEIAPPVLRQAILLDSAELAAISATALQA